MKFFDKHKASHFVTYGINYLETNAEKKEMYVSMACRCIYGKLCMIR